ncbi:SPBc2 prophage-derived glycosyltransferase SunS [Paenibacillus sp. P1XP2]|nr:SPBc2 prophage-derived glycosyltransferase SunS [Paenibacillus sp. P1XP2]
MITISLCMIVKNEEKSLERCLSSVQKAVDQMIIVDTGSTDNTKQIARKFTRYVYDFEWIDDFAQRATLRSAMRKWIIFYGWTRMIF